jgi:hypothetical protein
MWTSTPEPSMPSGNGKPDKALTCRCADCTFAGSLGESIAHYYLTNHTLTYKGIKQDFSHLRPLNL